MESIDLPPLVRERALSNGVAGKRWLDELPNVVAALSAQWELEVGRAFAGGTAGFVALATDAHGHERVLKVAMPLDMDEREAFTRSVHTHRLADGTGCALLIAADESAPAMLLERLGPNLAELALPLPELLEAICSTLQTFWRPIESSVGLRTGSEQAACLARFIAGTWDALNRPCERTVIDRAITFCERRIDAFDSSRAVLAHGDAHGWNTVAAGDGSYKFVDPEGLWTEPEHDLAVAMREYNEPLMDGDTSRLVRARAQLLASRCEVDPEAVWQWGFIERVSTGLANMRDFDNDDGAMFLEVARRSG